MENINKEDFVCKVNDTVTLYNGGFFHLVKNEPIPKSIDLSKVSKATFDSFFTQKSPTIKKQSDKNPADIAL